MAPSLDELKATLELLDPYVNQFFEVKTAQAAAQIRMYEARIKADEAATAREEAATAREEAATARLCEQRLADEARLNKLVEAQRLRSVRITRRDRLR
jgi:hypothetical protein